MHADKINFLLLTIYLIICMNIGKKLASTFICFSSNKKNHTAQFL